MNVSKAEQTARRALLLQQVIAGHTYAQLRQELGVSADTIARDLRAINRQLEQWAAEQQNRALSLAIAQYQRVIDQAWADHDADARNEQLWLAGEFAAEVQVPDPVDGARTERKTQQQFRSQKADYLRVIVAATEKLCKLAGLEAAAKVDVRAAVGGQVEVRHSFSQEHTEQVAAVLAEAGILLLPATSDGNASLLETDGR